jgi:hypothetical protein
MVWTQYLLYTKNYWSQELRLATVFWVTMLWSLHPEDGGMFVLWNVGILQHRYSETPI